MKLGVRTLLAVFCAVAIGLGASSPATAAKTVIHFGANFVPRDVDGNCLNVVANVFVEAPVDSFEFVSALAPLKGKALKDAIPTVVPAVVTELFSSADYAVGFVALDAPFYVYIKAVRDGRVIAKTAESTTC